MGKIKFRAKAGGDFKLPPEGTYDFEITDVKEDKPDKNGDPTFIMQLKIADGDASGMEVRWYHRLSEKMAWTLRAAAEAAGVDYSEEPGAEGEAPEIEVDLDDFIGRYFRADITHFKADNGNFYPNFRNLQVSPLQTAANGDTPDTPDDGAGNEEPAAEPAKASAKPAVKPAAAPAGTARPRPQRTA